MCVFGYSGTCGILGVYRSVVLSDIRCIRGIVVFIGYSCCITYHVFGCLSECHA